MEFPCYPLQAVPRFLPVVIRVRSVCALPLMEGKGRNALHFRDHVFMGKIFGDFHGSDFHPLRFQKVPDLTAQKTVFVEPHLAEGKFSLPRHLRLFREIHQPLGTDADAVSHSADPSLSIPVSRQIPLFRQRPGRSDVIIIQKLVSPHLRMNHKAVRMHDHRIIRMDMTAQLVDHLIIEVIDVLQFARLTETDVSRQE